MKRYHNSDEMKILWKETFGDSREYVDLLFALYFSKDENIFLGEERNGMLVAGLVGIGYDFVDPASNNRMRGLYLCGLATRPKFRRQGIMENLMREAEVLAVKAGYDFCFLIPADEHLRNYYHRLGYEDEMGRGKLPISRFCENRKFSSDRPTEGKFSILINSEKIKTDPDLENSILEFINKNEAQYPGTTIRHTRRDIEGIIAENELADGIVLWIPNGALSLAEQNKTYQIFATDSKSAKDMIYELNKLNIEELCIPEVSPVWTLIDTVPMAKEAYIMTKPLTASQTTKPINAFLLLD